MLLAFAGPASAQKHVHGGPAFPNLNPGFSSKGPGWSPPGWGNSGKEVVGVGAPGKGPSDRGQTPSTPSWVDRGNAADNGAGSPNRGNGGNGASGGNGPDKGANTADRGNADKRAEPPGENVQASAVDAADTARKSRPLHALPTCQ
jgi:hypothetical protein